jgi:predicted RNA-binding Zn-ribbon protein involved in translation (DUF1610 family)
LERKLVLKSRHGFDCNCTACEQRLESNSQAFLCPKCSGSVTSQNEGKCLPCNELVINEKKLEEYDYFMRMSKMGNMRLITKDMDIRKAEHPLLQAHRYLVGDVFPSHRELGVVKEKLSVVYRVMKKYLRSVRFVHEFYECLKEDNDQESLAFFNGLLKVVVRERDFLEYCVRTEKTRDKGYVRDFRSTLIAFRENVPLLQSLAQRHTIPGSDQSRYYANITQDLGSQFADIVLKEEPIPAISDHIEEEEGEEVETEEGHHPVEEEPSEVD